MCLGQLGQGICLGLVRFGSVVFLDQTPFGFWGEMWGGKYLISMKNVGSEFQKETHLTSHVFPSLRQEAWPPFRHHGLTIYGQPVMLSNPGIFCKIWEKKEQWHHNDITDHILQSAITIAWKIQVKLHENHIIISEFSGGYLWACSNNFYLI